NRPPAAPAMIAPPSAKISRQNSATSSVRNSPVRAADRKPMSPPVLTQKLRRQVSATASSTLQAASINSGPLPSPFKIPTAKGRKSGLGSICWPFTLTRVIANAIWTRLRYSKSRRNIITTENHSQQLQEAHFDHPMSGLLFYLPTLRHRRDRQFGKFRKPFTVMSSVL